MVDMKRLLTVLIVVTLTWSCAKSPMSPSPKLSVSVMVLEKSSRTPLENVDVEISFLVTSSQTSGSGSSRTQSFSSQTLVESGKTDANGAYTWSSVPDNVSSATITVAGAGDYESASRDVHMQAGDTHVDVELDRRRTYTLSGTVFEVSPDGPVPVERALISGRVCDQDYCSNLQATTDRNGHYSIPGIWAGLGASLSVFKTGYTVDDPRPFDCENCDRLVTASVDTQLDIPLVRR